MFLQRFSLQKLQLFKNDFLFGFIIKKHEITDYKYNINTLGVQKKATKINIFYNVPQNQVRFSL